MPAKLKRQSKAAEAHRQARKDKVSKPEVRGPKAQRDPTSPNSQNRASVMRRGLLANDRKPWTQLLQDRLLEGIFSGGYPGGELLRGLDRTHEALMDQFHKLCTGYSSTARAYQPNSLNRTNRAGCPWENADFAAIHHAYSRCAHKTGSANHAVQVIAKVTFRTEKEVQKVMDELIADARSSWDLRKRMSVWNREPEYEDLILEMRKIPKIKGAVLRLRRDMRKMVGAEYCTKR